MNKDIVLHLEGGCGNQLFQFMAGLRLARRKDSSLVVDTSQVRGNRHSGYCISDSSYLNEIPRVAFADLRKRSQASRRFRILTGRQCVAHGVGYPLNMDNLIKAKNVEGYFQTYHFYDELLEREVVNPKAIREDFKKLLNMTFPEEHAQNDFAIIHVRGGDYQSMAKSIGVLTNEYFEKGLKRFHSPVNKVYVVSDEPLQVISKKFGKTLDYEYLETSEVHPLALISLMSEFRKMVISNSTLSWWGAKLQEGGEIVAPAQWFKDLEDPKDLLQPGWHLQDSIWQE